MRVLVACEESQVVTIAFRARGQEAYSCDIQPCSGGHPEWHLQCDVLTVLDRGWDLMIAHPECTRLCNSGVRWLTERDLWEDMRKAADFFNKLKNAEQIPKRCVENPIPHRYAREIIGGYTQIIQPNQFGHPESKATCLWLFNLPVLIPTNIVGVAEQRIWKMPPSPERAKLRSKTFPGIAKAMAEQWG